MVILLTGIIFGLIFAPIEQSVAKVMPDFDEYVTTTTTTAAPTSQKPVRYEFMQCAEFTQLGECCNGLESNCDLRVNELMFAKAHNLMSSKDSTKYQFYNHFVKFEGSNETDGKGALEFGYRALNFDLCECDGELSFCHNFCFAGTRDPEEIFTVIDNYLDANPSEVIILNFQIVNQDSFGEKYNVTLDGLFSIMQGVGSFVDRMHVLDNTTEWPYMRTLVEKREQIIAFHHEGPTCEVEGECPTGLHYYFDYVGEGSFEIKDVAQMKDYALTCPITRGAESNNGRKNLYAINNFISISDENIAPTTNELVFIQERDSGCKDVTGLSPNMISVDYWSLGDLPEFTQEENKARANAKQSTAPRMRGLHV